jgi:putative restriction endonuclease
MIEVNFWQSSGSREFRVLAPGEPFFFKTRYPRNRLVGGGFFIDSARLRVSEAWEFFDEANGVASVEEMQARIGRYRRAPIRGRRRPADRLPVRPRRTLLPGPHRCGDRMELMSVHVYP